MQYTYPSILLLLPTLLTSLTQLHGEAPKSETHSVQSSEMIQQGAFRNFGQPSKASTHRGAFAVTGKNGKTRFLLSLNDWTGGYGLLLVDPKDGKSDFYPFPFKTDGSSFAILRSRSGRVYQQFGGYFTEFDPEAGTYLFTTKTRDVMSMMMTEDDHGVVWMGSYPKAHLMSYNPATKEFKEHGPMNEETWPQYPRSLATDDAGWVYMGICFTKTQIIAYNPATGERKKIVPEEERTSGQFDIRALFHKRAAQGTVWRGNDGCVYARLPNSMERPWFKLHDGTVLRAEEVSHIEPIKETAGSQFTFNGKLPEGGRITSLDVPKHTFRVAEANGREREVKFDYPSAGGRITSMTAGPDGRIYGSTGHPLQFFALDPKEGTFSLAPKFEGGHINALTAMGSSVFGAIYTQGVLIQHDTSKGSAVDIKRLSEAGEIVLRPFGLVPLSNAHELVMFGSPGYGRTGGGLLFYDKNSAVTKLMTHDQVIPDQSTKALVELPSGDLLGATTIEAGTGGQPVSREAELYILKMPEREVIFRKAVLPGIPQYRDLVLLESGLVAGLAGSNGSTTTADFYNGGDPLFFVFDPRKREIVHQVNLKKHYGTLTGSQAPRVMSLGPDGMLYVLFSHCIARIDPKTFVHEKVAETPVPVHAGIAIVDGMLYFSSGGEMWSYRLEDRNQQAGN